MAYWTHKVKNPTFVFEMEAVNNKVSRILGTEWQYLFCWQGRLVGVSWKILHAMPSTRGLTHTAKSGRPNFFDQTAKPNGWIWPYGPISYWYNFYLIYQNIVKRNYLPGGTYSFKQLSRRDIPSIFYTSSFFVRMVKFGHSIFYLFGRLVEN